jgi:hypothetical protein
MKIPHDYGVYLWWPEDGDAVFHPDDLQIGLKLIPSRRVFRRERLLGHYLVLRYGPHRVRIKPTLFLSVHSDGFDIGNQVQVLSRCGQNRPFIGRIAHMLWHVRAKRIEYYVRQVDQQIPRLYSAADLERIELVPRLPKKAQTEFVS